MEHGIKIELVETGEVVYLTHSQGVLLTGYTVSEPKLKEHTVEIDGRDGEIDFTGLFGTPKFKNRTVTATLNIVKIGNFNEQSEYHSRLMMKLHGQLVNITHWQRPYCYFQGRCSIGAVKKSSFSLAVNAEPHAYKNDLTSYSYSFAKTKNLVEAINIDNADTTKRWKMTDSSRQIFNNGVIVVKRGGASVYSPSFSVEGLSKLSFSCDTSENSLRFLLRKYDASDTRTTEYITLTNGKYEGWAIPSGIVKLEVGFTPTTTGNFPITISKVQVEAGGSCTDYVPKDGVLLVNDGKPVTPTFEATAETTMNIGGSTVTMSKGTHTYNLTIPNGETVLTASGSGTLTITYQERLL